MNVKERKMTIKKIKDFVKFTFEKSVPTLNQNGLKRITSVESIGIIFLVLVLSL